MSPGGVEQDVPLGGIFPAGINARGTRGQGRIDAMRDRFKQAGFETESIADFDEESGQTQVIEVTDAGFVAASDPRSEGAAAAW